VPGASAPILDGWAPAQYVAGSSGGSGPLRSPGSEDTSVNNAQQTTDQMIHWKIAGTIIMALVGVYVLQALGFRFVVAAGVGA
jgi:hypothetical protein